MTDFDFDKPYGSDWKRKLGLLVGTIVNTLIVLLDTALFVGAISVLWGWYFIGLVACVVLLARAIDLRGSLKKVLRRQIHTGKAERIAAIYFLVLVVIAVLVNSAFVLLYSLGHYQPPFG